MIYLELYFEFFKIGLFAIGGGLATIPFLYQLSHKTGWFLPEDIVNMFAISESTPGPIGINMATYAGFHAAGIPGAVIATLGIITPAILAIVIIISILKKYQHNKYFTAAFKGMFAAVCALITVSVWEIISGALFNTRAYAQTSNIADLFSLKAILLFTILMFAIYKFKKIHPFAFISASAAIGIFIQF